MKKNKFLKAAVAATLTLSMATLAGCNGLFQDEVGEELDAQTSHLFVGIYDGGFGADSWEAMATKFEELLKDESFEEGKKGVDVHIEAKKEEFLMDTLLQKIDSNQQDMYFTNSNLYEYANEEGGKIIDVTDVVKGTFQDDLYSTVYPDSRTIEQKFANDAIKDWTLNQNPDFKNSQKYYGVPVFVSTSSMIYDVDLWEEKGFYFSRSYEETGAGNPFTKGISGAPEKSYGQDGKQGTLDDGLPVTFADFQKMIAKIRSSNCIPLTFAGQYPVYVREYFNQFYANYEGYDDFMINLTFNGTDSEGTVVTPQEGYKVFGQRGRKKVLEFAQWIAGDENNFKAENCFNNGGHTETQDTFLLSDCTNDTPIAMLIEGNWWEHEAQSTLDDCANIYKRPNRRFGVMTFPIMDELDNRYNNPNAQTITYSIQPYSFAFITKKASSVAQRLGKLFLAYTSNDANLAYYTSVSGAPRPFKYTIDENGEDYARMSYYKKAVWENYKGVMDGTGNLVYTRGTNPISQFATEDILGKFGFEIPGQGNPIAAFRYDKTLTPESYANTTYTTYEAIWTTSYYNTFYLTV